MALLNKKSGENEHGDGGATQTDAGSTEGTKPAADGAAEQKPVAEKKPAAEKKEPRRAAKKGEGGERAAGSAGAVVAKIRTRVAQVVWLLFVVAALFLAVGALCIALGANKDNGAVRFVLDGAKFFDLGIFSRSNGIKTFGGDNAGVKNALFNWGIGAVLYLVVGRILERIIRP